MTIAVSLPQELQEFVEQSVNSGQFGSEAEVLVNALASLKTQEDFRQHEIDRLRIELQNALDQVKAEETHEWSVDDFKRRARIHLLRIHLAVGRQSQQDDLKRMSAAPPGEAEKSEGNWRY